MRTRTMNMTNSIEETGSQIICTVVPRFTATGTFDRLLIGAKVVNEFGGGHSF